MSKIFELPTLKFAFDALEPAIDGRTMEIHHGKHHAAYVANLNKALEAAPAYYEQPITAILRNLQSLPEAIRTAVRNNGGGHANHSLFWDILQPGGAKLPHTTLGGLLDATFGSYDAFVEKFSQAALTRFGSGWAWLALDAEKKLHVYSTPNQDSPLMDGHTPILGLDVWEHAYYLNYQNRRADYIKAFWGLVNWDVVQQAYEAA
ncbi:MAG TPA: superoxide dismutase [Anaerolineaceae bacterium]|jgi:Fe-Mn family superoxide dismutase|nr:superoxide dismutase [Anaerolineaceae bacterium]